MMLRSTITFCVLALFVAAVGCSKKPGPNAVIVKPALGSLELVIAANADDDAAAIAVAKDYFERAQTDPGRKAELQRRAKAGEPPPAPDVGATPFIVHGQVCTYRWAALSASQLKDQHIDAPPTDPTERGGLYERLNEARQKGIVYSTDGPNLGIYCGLIWWSRDRGDRSGIEYFILLRESPPEEAVGSEIVEILWDPDAAKDGAQHIEGRLSDAGTKRFADLTKRNQPTKSGPNESVERSLTILVRGQVVSIACIKEPITKGPFWISGGWDADQARKLVEAMRGE